MVLRNVVLAVFAGVLLYVGHPPLAIAGAGFVAVVPLVALARDLVGGRLRTAFGYGTLAGVVAFAPLLYWLIPFGYLAFGLLVVVQSLYLGAFTALVCAYGERRGRAVFTVAAWVGIEALRASFPIDGFAWGALAYTQADGGLVLGVARTFGAAGVSLVLATVAVAIEEAIRAGLSAWSEAREAAVPADVLFTRMRTPILTALGVLSLAVLVSGAPPEPTGERTEFAIVQGGDTRGTAAAGVNRIDTGRIIRVAELMAEATEQLADDPPDVVIWPENALDGDVRQPRWSEVADLLDQSLETVAPAPIIAGDTIDGDRPNTRYNAMTVFTQDGIGESYRKQRPVPFAEYIPLRDWLDWIPPLEQVPSDVLRGDGPQVLSVAGAEVGSVICFENTYADIAIQQVRAGANVLVVSTNNSSFGDTPMSDQHIAFSQVRAVETGRWVVHAGLSGISGYISPDGEVHQRTELFEPATLVRDIPLIEEMTVAVRIGDVVGSSAIWLTLIGVGIIAIDLVRRRRAGHTDVDPLVLADAEPEDADGVR